MIEEHEKRLFTVTLQVNPDGTYLVSSPTQGEVLTEVWKTALHTVQQMGLTVEMRLQELVKEREELGTKTEPTF